MGNKKKTANYTGILYGWMTTRTGLSQGLSAASGDWSLKNGNYQLPDGTKIRADSAQKIPEKCKQ